MSLKKDFPKVEYRIKLLSGNNVVLVEAFGFESEIFVPEIQNGRISFQNIVPNRRCCYMGQTPTSKSLIRKKRRSMQSAIEQHSGNPKSEIMSPCRTWRLQGGSGGLSDINRTRSPLAFSTPAPAPSPTPSYIIKQQMKYNKENYQPRQPRTLAQAYNTIELLRPKPCTPLAQRQQRQTENQHTPVTKTVRIQCQQAEIEQHMRANGGASESGSDFNIPDVPTLTPCSPQSSADSTKPNKGKNRQIEAPGTVTKWRKCLTPKRTYSRQAFNGPAAPAHHDSNVKKIRHTKSLLSATQGAKGEYKLEVRRRKLIIDPKTAISPNTFKKHLKGCGGEGKVHSKSTLPKDRKRYDVCKNTAFDMLTTASRNSVMAAKLQQQFRKACVNKASSTCPKYKILCKLPPLEETRRIKVNLLPTLPACKLTTAAMLEKACSSAIQTCEHVPHAKLIRWPSQQ